LLIHSICRQHAKLLIYAWRPTRTRTPEEMDEEGSKMTCLSSIYQLLASAMVKVKTATGQGRQIKGVRVDDSMWMTPIREAGPGHAWPWRDGISTPSSSPPPPPGICHKELGCVTASDRQAGSVRCSQSVSESTYCPEVKWLKSRGGAMYCAAGVRM
jgi:hypothetical protein